MTPTTAPNTPHRNRVTPAGDIVAIPLRGAWTGNRGGCLHVGTEIVRPWSSRRWLVCALHFKDWQHEQWVPNRLTWLFFHDEAVAFAAGHRPCALCRRGAFLAFRDRFEAAGPGPGADDLDRHLHQERQLPRSRQRRWHEADWSALPDGAFVLAEEGPAVVIGAELVHWTPTGYGRRRPRPTRGPASVITPPATIAVLRAGYPVQIDAAARSSS